MGARRDISELVLIWSYTYVYTNGHGSDALIRTPEASAKAFLLKLCSKEEGLL